ncbi:MAG: hypothetical protein HC786_17430 [Richelia sp. CSU_2_1]|nr:hypothetical protein [Microcoleus sp. SU_5_6]NJL68233.1 hypothetical protein [Microcoleus sp. SM1_3_4]NJR23801.1 hypothetical protein [Richelia sp. CSU_2_1]
MSSVGAKLKQRRQSLSLTQQQIADVLGVIVAGKNLRKLLTDNRDKFQK